MTKRSPHVAAALLLLAAWLGGRGGYIYLKAGLAQILLRRAWASTQAGVERARPWPWADTSPVGRLRVASRGVDLIILSGTSGRTLAFGPGHVDGTDRPGRCGNCILSGHRDTHFAFLSEILPGDEIVIEGVDGVVQHFQVSALEVVDQSDVFLLGDDDIPRLTLITCYPFDAVVPGGPLRYVVRAELVDFERLNARKQADPRS